MKQDYYPFGMLMPGRTYSSPTYRYGFNGKVKDDEIKNTGMDYDYGFRIYDVRLAKFLSVDPLAAKFSFYTPYQFGGNKPTYCLDIDGQEDIGYLAARLFNLYRETVIKPSDAEQVKGNAWKNRLRGVAYSLTGLVDAYGITNGVFSYSKNYIQGIESAKDGSAADKYLAWNPLTQLAVGIGTNIKQAINGNTFAQGQLVADVTTLALPFAVKVSTFIKGSAIFAEGDAIIQNAANTGAKFLTADAEGIKYLDNIGAEASFMPTEGGRASSILLRPGASRAANLEESIHHSQMQKYGEKFMLSNRLQLEIEAQNKLLDIGKKEGWAQSEMDRILNAKEVYTKELETIKKYDQ